MVMKIKQTSLSSKKYLRLGLGRWLLAGIGCGLLCIPFFEPPLWLSVSAIVCAVLCYVFIIGYVLNYRLLGVFSLDPSDHRRTLAQGPVVRAKVISMKIHEAADESHYFVSAVVVISKPKKKSYKTTIFVRLTKAEYTAWQKLPWIEVRESLAYPGLVIFDRNLKHKLLMKKGAQPEPIEAYSGYLVKPKKNSLLIGKICLIMASLIIGVCLGLLPIAPKAAQAVRHASSEIMWYISGASYVKNPWMGHALAELSKKLPGSELSAVYLSHDFVRVSARMHTDEKWRDYSFDRDGFTTQGMSPQQPSDSFAQFTFADIDTNNISKLIGGAPARLSIKNEKQTATYAELRVPDADASLALQVNVSNDTSSKWLKTSLSGDTLDMGNN
jgi:hypothetical protein